MGGHDPRIGGCDGFGADKILAEPGQAFAPECANILPTDRLGADVARLGDQGGAQAGLEMLDTGLPFAQMREGLGEAGTPHDLQKEIGHGGLGHSSLNGRAQCAQAFGVLQPVERCDDDARLALHGLEPQVGIARRPVRDGAVGAIEQLRQACDFGIGIERAIERPANHQLGRLPGRPIQQPAPWISVPSAWAGETCPGALRRRAKRR